MAGYIDKTTIYSVVIVWPYPPPPGCLGTPGYTSHTKVYFVDFPGATSVARPVANLVLGKTYSWWEHVLCRPDAIGGSTTFNNYTNGVPGSTREGYTAFGWIPPFMRNLHCDHSPYLLQEVPPFNTPLPYDVPTNPADIYSSLPNYQTADPQSPRDNQYLYHNPSYTGYEPHKTWLQNPPTTGGLPLPPTSWVSQSIISPPATTNVSPSSYLYTDLPPPQGGGHVPFTFIFGPYGSCSGSTLSFGVWGLNDAPSGCPDDIPYVAGFDLLGMRFNCERNGSNLQSFLSINGEVVETASGTLRAAPPRGSELLRKADSLPSGLQLTLQRWLEDWRK